MARSVWHCFLVSLVLPLLAGGCGISTQPELRGVVAVPVEMDGSHFDIRIRGNKAEAIRTNFEMLPKYSDVRAKARRAINKISKCPVATLGGDPSVIFAKLSCL